MSFFATRNIVKTDPKENQPDAAPAAEAADALDIKKLCREMTVMIPYRASEGLNPMLFEYAMNWRDAGMLVIPFRDPFGGFVEMTRNVMTKVFLKDRARKYLVMIDNDICPRDSIAPVLLARHNLPVVSGIACAYNPEVGLFACIGVLDDTGRARFPTARDTKVMPAQGIREIESAGAGILCIRRDVLEAVWAKQPPFNLTEEIRLEAATIGTLRKTEDISFCDKVRAAGYKLYADFEAQCFHDKKIPIHWDSERIDPDLKAEDWNVTPFGMLVEQE